MMPLAMTRNHVATAVSCLLVGSLFFAACSGRVSGQVELLGVDKDGEVARLANFKPYDSDFKRGINPKWGDPIRSNDDVVTIQVESAYLQSLPFRLTGSKDVIIFADVWENGAMGSNSKASLTSIVYTGPNEKVPGRLNFRDMLAYGPTKFKGHPLRVRFTVMVLQKAAADSDSSAIDIISAIAEAAAPQYSPITSEVAKTLKGILKAQPDISAFDFDATLVSDQPEGLADIVVQETKKEGGESSRYVGMDSRRPEPTTSRTFLAGTATRGEGIHWMRYGRYVLLETESHDGKMSAVAGLKPGALYYEDGWLRRPGGEPLASSYLVFRITPGLLDEKSEILQAASDSNLQLLQTLRRSDSEIAEGLKAVTDSAKDLKAQVLHAKAEELARQIVRDAESKKADAKAALDTEFPKKWSDATRWLRGEDATSAQKVKTEVLNRWDAKFASPSAPQT